eukprot:2702934-Alexandrium_andersonii.AAC.1
MQMGLCDVERDIQSRQRAYIGHVARLPRARVERNVLRLWLGTRGGPKTRQRLMTQRRIDGATRHSGLDASERRARRGTFAGSGGSDPSRGGCRMA